MARLYAATGDGIARLDEAGHEWRVELFLRGSGAQCLAVDPADPDTLYAGLRAGGVCRSHDGGRGWVESELVESGVFSVAVSAVDGALYAGTEPSRLFRSEDGGASWRELEGLLELPSRPSWRFPPRPWTSHVRWIAPSPHDAYLSPICPRALACARRRASPAAAGDAVRLGGRRRPPLRRTRRRADLGKRRSGRKLARLHAARRFARGAASARVREHLSRDPFRRTMALPEA